MTRISLGRSALLRLSQLLKVEKQPHTKVVGIIFLSVRNILAKKVRALSE